MESRVGEVCADRADIAHRTHKPLVAKLAAGQAGCVTWAQLRMLGVAGTTIRRWRNVGYLLPLLPRVYAVGHLSSGERMPLFGLILFAGPDAALSHGTAAHWRGWLRYPVAATHLSTPRQIRAGMPGAAFHGRRGLERDLVDGLPCTTVTQTLLDLAATEPLNLVRRALAQLDFERRLDPDAIREVCGPGRAGSGRLLNALDTHLPQLARTKSALEEEFLALCERYGIPMPEVNTLIHGIEVDCHWPQFRLVVELDGDANHGTSAQRNRDQRNALKLRSHGLTVVRYTWDQVIRHAAAVADDLRAHQPAATDG